MSVLTDAPPTVAVPSNKRAVASDELAQKFKTEKDTPYLRWVRGEGLDIVGAHYVRNLRTVELKPWARRGGCGVFLNHDASRTTNDCYVCEIPPAGKLHAQRQLFEEMVFVLDGRGSTTVWNDAGARITFEWKAGAIFGIPLNCWHQHFNGSGQAPVRYVAVTKAPPVIIFFVASDFCSVTVAISRDASMASRTISPPARSVTNGRSRPISFRMRSICRFRSRRSAAPGAGTSASISPGHRSPAISRNS